MGCLKLTYKRNNATLKVAYSVYGESLKNCTGSYRYGINGIVKDCEGYVGINEHVVQNINFKVYPNPSTGFFYYEYNVDESNADATLTVIDMMGKTIIAGTVNTANAKGMLNLSELPNGIYFINLSTSQKQLFTSKLSVVK